MSNQWGCIPQKDGNHIWYDKALYEESAGRRLARWLEEKEKEQNEQGDDKFEDEKINAIQ